MTEPIMHRRNTRYTPSVTDPTSLAAHLRQMEEELFQPEVRRSPGKISAYLAEEFREFGSSGHIYTKAEILAELSSESPRTITLDNFQCEALAPDVALVTYRSTRTIALGIPVHANRSSLWVFRQGRWQMLFHQGTPE
jgi:hypothetical protein